MNRQIEERIINTIALDQAINSIDNDYKLFVFLIFLMGFNHRQLAKIIGCSHQRIAQIIRECQATINRKLSDNEPTRYRKN